MNTINPTVLTVVDCERPLGSLRTVMVRQIIAVCGFVALLSVPPVSAAEHEYVGAEACGSCHAKEYRQWKKSGHAQALDRLSKTQQRDRVCRSCHTTEPLSNDPALSGVQCESCHGAGRFYAPRHVMKDPKLAPLMGLKPVTEATCVQCHRADGPSVKPFDFAAQLELVRHTGAGADKGAEPGPGGPRGSPGGPGK